MWMWKVFAPTPSLLPPLLNSLYTNRCKSWHEGNHILQFCRQSLCLCLAAVMQTIVWHRLNSRTGVRHPSWKWMPARQKRWSSILGNLLQPSLHLLLKISMETLCINFNISALSVMTSSWWKKLTSGCTFSTDFKDRALMENVSFYWICFCVPFYQLVWHTFVWEQKRNSRCCYSLHNNYGDGP